VAEATTRLGEMLAEAAGSAGVSLGDISRTCFGLAGLTIPAVRAWATAAIAERVGGELILCGDEEIALDAAFRGGPGILVIAGTGSNVIGRTAGGGLVSAGGWGPVLGDEGAGYWIGLEGIRAALRARDREEVGDAEALLREIQGAWKLGSLAELIDVGNQRGDGVRPVPDFASLAPVVARCAEQGNGIAVGILKRAGEDLAGLVALVARKMAESDSGRAALEVAYTGSVLSEIARVRGAMLTELARTLPSATVQGAAVDSLDGALWRARNG
jgi:glucosamine kinase